MILAPSTRVTRARLRATRVGVGIRKALDPPVAASSAPSQHRRPSRRPQEEAEGMWQRGVAYKLLPPSVTDLATVTPEVRRVLCRASVRATSRVWISVRA